MKNKLTVDDIFEKEFKTKLLGGLHPQDVDNFLNDVIDDYETFEKIINDLREQNELLREENFKIKMGVINKKNDTLDMTKDIEIQQITQTDDILKNDTIQLKNDDLPANSDVQQRLAQIENQLTQLLNQK